jgi:hypothetical protein
MREFKTDGVADETESATVGEQGCADSPDMVRREFLKRFGLFAAGSAVGLYVLMSAKSSKAEEGSDGGGT